MVTAVHIWAIRQRVNEDGDRLGSRDWWDIVVTLGADGDCERPEQDNGLNMMGLCVLYWMRMLGTVGNESKSPRNCWSKLNGTIVGVLRVQGYVDFSVAHRYLCELC